MFVLPTRQGCAKKINDAKMFATMNPISAARVPGDVSKSEVEVISMFAEVFHACAVKRRGDTRRTHGVKSNIFISGPCSRFPGKHISKWHITTEGVL